MTNRSERRKAEKVCDENGEVIADEDRVMDRWKECFANLYPVRRKNIQKEEAVTEEEGIGIEEVAKLKGGKAPCVCVWN